MVLLVLVGVVVLLWWVGGGERVLLAAAAEKAPLVCWARRWGRRLDGLPTSWNDIVACYCIVYVR